MANCDWCPERRSRSKDKAAEVDRDKALRGKVVIKAGPRQRRAQIKAQARARVMAADGVVAVVVETRTSKMWVVESRRDGMFIDQMFNQMDELRRSKMRSVHQKYFAPTELIMHA